MSLYRDEAVVLRRHKLGEADRIVTLLTRHHGVVRAVAKGVRRTSSRFGARLEPGMHVDLQLAQGRSLDVVTQAVTLHAFAEGLVSDYSVYTTATVVLETAERVCGAEHEPATQQHLLLVGAMRALSTRAHDLSMIPTRICCGRWRLPAMHRRSTRVLDVRRRARMRHSRRRPAAWCARCAGPAGWRCRRPARCGCWRLC